MSLSLFINGADQESIEAKILLDSAGLSYKCWDVRELRTNEVKPPLLFAPEGEFASLERIRSYVRYRQLNGSRH